MSPEYLPELLLLIAAAFLIVVACHSLFARRFVRAVQIAFLGTACAALAILGGKYAHRHNAAPWVSKAWERSALRPEQRADSSGTGPETSGSVTLVLGSVPIHVMASNGCVLSANSEEFLTLDSLETGLRVTCDVAGWQSIPTRAPMLAASVRENLLVSTGPGVRSTRPDANTILLQQDSRTILRVHYVSPRRIEIDGEFYLTNGQLPSKITFVDGIRWAHGRIDPGSGVDLTPQGIGRIDFSDSGMIQLVRK